MTTSFSTRLHENMLSKNTRVCVGLDPRLEWLPAAITNKAKKEHGVGFVAAGKAIEEFNRKVIDIVVQYAAAVKPQIAFYEQYGPSGLEALLSTIQYAHQQGLEVIIDAKRGDIDSTAAAYANSLLGETVLFGTSQPCYDVDCITVNPFLGEDSLVPFLETCQRYGKGIFILVKTSNPGSDDIQALKVKGKTISAMMAGWVAKYAHPPYDRYGYANIGAVVGATFPEEAKKMRTLMPHSIFLVPGLGPQGGDVHDIGNFFNADGLGAVINSSREIVFSQKSQSGPQYQTAILENVKQLRKIINQGLKL